MTKIEQSIIESAKGKLLELESLAIEPVNEESTSHVLSRFWMISGLIELALFDSGLSESAALELQKIEAKCAAILAARSVVIEASRPPARE